MLKTRLYRIINVNNNVEYSKYSDHLVFPYASWRVFMGGSFAFPRTWSRVALVYRLSAGWLANVFLPHRKQEQAGGLCFISLFESCAWQRLQSHISCLAYMNKLLFTVGASSSEVDVTLCGSFNLTARVRVSGHNLPPAVILTSRIRTASLSSLTSKGPSHIRRDGSCGYGGVSLPSPACLPSLWNHVFLKWAWANLVFLSNSVESLKFSIFWVGVEK